MKNDEHLLVQINCRNRKILNWCRSSPISWNLKKARRVLARKCDNQLYRPPLTGHPDRQKPTELTRSPNTNDRPKLECITSIHYVDALRPGNGSRWTINIVNCASFLGQFILITAGLAFSGAAFSKKKFKVKQFSRPAPQELTCEFGAT